MLHSNRFLILTQLEEIDQKQITWYMFSWVTKEEWQPTVRVCPLYLRHNGGAKWLLLRLLLSACFPVLISISKETESQSNSSNVICPKGAGKDGSAFAAVEVKRIEFSPLRILHHLLLLSVENRAKRHRLICPTSSCGASQLAAPPGDRKVLKLFFFNYY